MPTTTDHIATLPDTIREDVSDCPRCGEDHPPIVFNRFHRPPPLGHYLYWTTCPSTGEPILARPK